MTKVKYFHAEWCGPCEQQKDIIKEVEAEEGINVDSIDIEEQEDMANNYSVRSLPTIIIEDGEEVVDQFTGVTSKSDILSSFRDCG